MIKAKKPLLGGGKVFDVAVAGHHPATLALALTLGRQGLRVAVAAGPEPRGGGLVHQETLDLLAALAPGDPLPELAAPLHHLSLLGPAGETLAALEPGQDAALAGWRAAAVAPLAGALLDALRQIPTVTLLPAVHGLLRDRQGRIRGLATAEGDAPARWTAVAAAPGAAPLPLAPAAPPRPRPTAYAVTVRLPGPVAASLTFRLGGGETAACLVLPGGTARLALAVGSATAAWLDPDPGRRLAYVQSRLATFFPHLAVPLGQVLDPGAVDALPLGPWPVRRWVAPGLVVIPTPGEPVPGRLHLGGSLRAAVDLGHRLAHRLAAGDLRPRDLAPWAARLRQWVPGTALTRAFPLLAVSSAAGHWAQAHLARRLALAPRTAGRILGMYAGLWRPPAPLDHLFVPAALLMPQLDLPVARLWGRILTATTL